MSLVDQAHIQPYLPQHPPFLMVDTLERIDDKSAVSTFNILSDNILLEAGLFTEAGLIENIAQTAALHAGYHFSTQAQDKGKTMDKAPMGFIGAIKDFHIFRQPQVGDVLYTTMLIEHQIGNASVIKGEIKVGEEVVASGELKIFLQES